ncbi:DUF6479 family protein [Yinghuangia sp. YIM S10712]|uniref:DUF6479 family protein n=1 Tax=Yinghuangia sp. YIM S10712 TaxID=3436930 RepID=UPI003F539065
METQLLAANDMGAKIAAIFLVAAIIAGLLIWPVVRGVRLRRPPPPRSPRTEAWTAHDSTVSARREPNEMPRDGVRRLPHELAGFGTLGSRPREEKRPEDEDEQRRDQPRDEGQR